MSVVFNLLALVGWRGAVGVAIGAVLSGGVALPAGRWVERLACTERIGRAIAEHDLQEMELNDARIAAALEARHRADRNSLGADGGGLPDDGYRRD